jgi:hypothetical protein
LRKKENVSISGAGLFNCCRNFFLIADFIIILFSKVAEPYNDEGVYTTENQGISLETQAAMPPANQVVIPVPPLYMPKKLH